MPTHDHVNARVRLRVTVPDGRPLRLATATLSDATDADRARRRELVLHALEMARAAAPRRRPVSRFTG